MKCTIKSLLALMAGAVMLGSCSDDYFETKSGAAKTGNMSFTATVDGAESRASFTGESLSFMKPNIEISVFSNRQNSKFTMNDEGIFVGNCDESDEYYAVSPYSESNKVQFDGSTYDFVIDWNGAEQTLDLNENYAPMVARAKNIGEGALNVPLVFQNVCGFIKFTTDYVCKSITLKSRGGEDLAAKTLYVDYDSNCKPHIFIKGTPNQTITLTDKDGGNIEAGTYYIPVLPGKLSKGVDITFTNKYKEKTCTKTLTNSGTLVCGEAMDLGKINIKSEMVHLAGTGTEADPYLIHDFDQLMEMHDFVNNSTGGGDCYKLVDDIDCQGHEISPIGNFDRMFCGTFDGGNHCIKNLCVNGSMEYTIPTKVTSETNRVCSLFGAIKAATIKNLTIDSPSINIDNGEKMTFSPFVGVTYCANANYDASRCKILNCELTGSCIINHTSEKRGTYVCQNYGLIYGGFVGCNQSNLEISDCSTDMRLDTYYSGQYNSFLKILVGGYIGLAIGANTQNATSLEHDGEVRISNCRNNSPYMYIKNETFSHAVFAGGFIGAVMDLSAHDVTCFFENCVNNARVKADITSDSAYLGGFVGNHDSDGVSGSDPCFKNCVNNGDIIYYNLCKYDNKVGGFTGYNYDDDTKFINCANTGKLTTPDGDNAPGAISYKNGDCTNCYNCATDDYKIIVVSAGKMTNTGHKTIDEVVGIMNSTELVWKNGFSHWRKKTVNGREILDLYTVKGPNIPQ